MRHLRGLLKPLPMLAIGLVLGTAARLFDIYFQNLGNIFSQIAIWILIGTLISVYSPTKKRAAMNVLPFCLGMLLTYYATAMLTRWRWPPESSEGFAAKHSSGSSTRWRISRTRRFRSSASNLP